METFKIGKSTKESMNMARDMTRNSLHSNKEEYLVNWKKGMRHGNGVMLKRDKTKYGG